MEESSEEEELEEAQLLEEELQLDSLPNGVAEPAESGPTPAEKEEGAVVAGEQAEEEDAPTITPRAGARLREQERAERAAQRAAERAKRRAERKRQRAEAERRHAEQQARWEAAVAEKRAQQEELAAAAAAAGAHIYALEEQAQAVEARKHELLAQLSQVLATEQRGRSSAEAGGSGRAKEGEVLTSPPQVSPLAKPAATGLPGGTGKQPGSVGGSGGASHRGAGAGPSYYYRAYHLATQNQQQQQQEQQPGVGAGPSPFAVIHAEPYSHRGGASGSRDARNAMAGSGSRDAWAAVGGSCSRDAWGTGASGASRDAWGMLGGSIGSRDAWATDERSRDAWGAGSAAGTPLASPREAHQQPRGGTGAEDSRRPYGGSGGWGQHRDHYSRVCFRCGGTGHIAREVKYGQQTVVVLTD